MDKLAWLGLLKWNIVYQGKKPQNPSLWLFPIIPYASLVGAWISRVCRSSGWLFGCKKSNGMTDYVGIEGSRRWKTYKHVILYPDEMASSEIRRRKWWNEKLFRLPVIGAAGSDLAPADGRQLPALCLHHLVLGDVLDRLKQKKIIFRCDSISRLGYESEWVSKFA